MARIIPSDLATLYLAGVRPQEIDTLRRLRDELPADYTVFHGVHWTRERENWCLFGEIDFAVVNQSGDVLVVEQKDGAVEERDGHLVKRYGSNSKDIVQQLHASMDTLREKFRNHCHRRLEHVDYLAYLPDHKLIDVRAPGIDASRIVDATSKAALATRIQQLLSPGDRSAAGAQDRLQAVVDFFTQTLRLVPDVSAHVAAQDRAYTSLAQSLAEVVGRLEFAPFRLRVIGAAGSGKSQLGLEFCQRMLEQGRRPLAVCFNRPLADRLRALMPAGSDCYNYHAFLNRFLEAQGERPDFTTGLGQSPELWRKVQERVIELSVPPEWRYDALIVDEGQDFQLEWYEILQLFLTDGATVLWLEDPEQNLYGRSSAELPGFVTYRDARNFRTPQTIARFIERALPGVTVDARNPTPGLGVEVFEFAGNGVSAEMSAAQIAAVAHRITELVRIGFRHEDIAIVSCVGRERSAFRDLDRIGALPLRRWTGQYTADGLPIHTEGKVSWDTIYRFKGQQAPAVILVDVPDAPSSADDVAAEERFRRLLYCGMTRATVKLEIVVADGHSCLGQFRRTN